MVSCNRLDNTPPPQPVDTATPPPADAAEEDAAMTPSWML